MGLEHQVEVPGLGEAVPVAADGTGCIEVDLIGAEAGLTDLTVNHRVGEVGNVTAGLPHSGVHEDGGIEAYDVIVHLGHFLPPEVTDVVLEVDTERTVVVCAVKASVDL